MRALSLLVPAVLACSDAKPAPAPPPPERTPAITQLAVGTAHTCALHDDGRVWCWGSNEHGQLGIEKLAKSMVPLVVPNVRGAAELAASEATTCVRYADHTVDCWASSGRPPRSRSRRA